MLSSRDQSIVLFVKPTNIRFCVRTRLGWYHIPMFKSPSYVTAVEENPQEATLPPSKRTDSICRPAILSRVDGPRILEEEVMHINLRVEN